MIISSTISSGWQMSNSILDSLLPTLIGLNKFELEIVIGNCLNSQVVVVLVRML